MPTKGSKATSSPINLPAIIILAILVLGLVVTLGLVDIRQIFSPKAGGPGIEFFGDGVSTNSQGQTTTTSPTVNIRLTSPYTTSSDPTTNAKPIYEDDFNPNNKRLGVLSFADVNNGTGCKGRSYENGAYQMLIRSGKGENQPGLSEPSDCYLFTTSAAYKEIGSSWSAVFDAQLSGEGKGKRGIGMVIGGRGTECGSSSEDCYKFYIFDDGEVKLYYQPNSNEFPQLVFQKQSGLQLPKNAFFKMRVDRNTEKVKMWVNLGMSWVLVGETGLGKVNTGYSLGFGISGAESKNPSADFTTVGRVDNLKVYKLGDLPEPNSGGYYRYSATQGDIEEDPNGDRVKWQAMSSNPVEVVQTFSSDQGAKYFFAQFKDNNGKVSQVYASKVILGTASTGDTPPIPPTTTSYSACGKSGTLASNYEPLTTCNPGTYLVVEQYDSYLEPTCRAIPPGFVRDTNDVCKIVSSTSLVPSNPCLSQAGFACGDSNGATRSGKSCNVYQSSFNSGCAPDNVYPYCWSSCN